MDGYIKFFLIFFVSVLGFAHKSVVDFPVVQAGSRCYNLKHQNRQTQQRFQQKKVMFHPSDLAKKMQKFKKIQNKRYRKKLNRKIFKQ